MLSILPETVQLHQGAVATFLKGPLTDLGRLWHIVIGKKEFKIELPAYDHETQLITFRKMRYGLANIALPNCVKMLSRYDSKVLQAIRNEEPEIEDWEIMSLLNEGPDQWHYDAYLYKSGLRLAKEALAEVILKAFTPDRPAQPHWVQERIMRELRQGSGENRAATIFYMVDDTKPRDADRVQRVVLFRDRQMIEAWLKNHNQAHFSRSHSFAGRLDFLATQGDESMYKSFLIEGVRIAENGELVGRNERQTMISTTWCVPMGASIDPVRGGIIGNGNKYEGVEMFIKEHGWVEHNPLGEDRIDVLDATAWDEIRNVPNQLPGINALVGLATWPQWNVKDGVLISQSFADRAVHQVPQHFSFWTGEDFRFVVPEGQDPSRPPQDVIEPRQVICLDGGNRITAPEDLLKGAVVDQTRYRRNVSYCQDPSAPVVWFTLNKGMRESDELRLGVQEGEHHLSARQFLAARGLEGNWQLVRLPDQAVMTDDEVIADSRILQARPYYVQYHHQLLFICNVPLVTGCKISTRTGSYKGVVRVVEDELMPHVMMNGDMQPLDMVIAQENIPSRGIALALLGEMALGKWGMNNNKTVLAGRNVTREQVLAVAGDEAQPERLVWYSRFVQFKTDSGDLVEGRLIMNTASWGEASYYAVSVDGQLVEVCDKEFVSYEDGRLVRDGEAHITHGAVGPLFTMIMNRHPLVVAGIRPSVRRNSAHLPQRGEGSVALGLNEFQVMRSLGMEEAAAQLSYHDAESSNYARELCESLLGGIYRVGAPSMTELEQALITRGLDRTVLDNIDPNLVDTLADVAAGCASSRRSILIEGRPNTHWQFSVVQGFWIDPAYKQHEQAWRGEIGATVRYALYLQDAWPWKLVSEVDDGAGGAICTFQRMDEQGQPRAQVIYRKVVGAFETRSIPVTVADDGELDTES